MNREKLAAVFSFILIFAFNSVDNAIAPLVTPLSRAFAVQAGHALWLISACTAGTVVGLIFGPAALDKLKTDKLLLLALFGLVASQVLFGFSENFRLALALRGISGVCAGLIATIMWRLAFHGVSKENMPVMMAVLMSARPLATAIGVPLSAIGAWKYSWQTPVWAMAAITAAGGFFLHGT